MYWLYYWLCTICLFFIKFWRNYIDKYFFGTKACVVVAVVVDDDNAFVKPLEDPRKTTGILLEALKGTGQRGIIDRGWGGLGNCK